MLNNCMSWQGVEGGLLVRFWENWKQWQGYFVHMHLCRCVCMCVHLCRGLRRMHVYRKEGVGLEADPPAVATTLLSSVLRDSIMGE